MRPGRRARRGALLGCLWLSTAAGAAAPAVAPVLAPADVTADSGARLESYRHGWPLQLPADSPALRIELEPQVYAQLVRDDLRDIELFNAAGESLPLGPMPVPPPTPAASVTVPWFVLSKAAPDRGDDRLRLQIERAPDGQLRRIDVTAGDRGGQEAGSAGPAAGGNAVGQGDTIVLDLSALDAAIAAIELHWPQAGDRSARFRIEASDDLDDWRMLDADVAIVDLERAGQRLLRRAIDLGPTAAPYLRLVRLDRGAPLPITGVDVRPAAPAAATVAALRWIELPADAGSGAREWHYTLPGPLPVEQLAVLPQQVNSVAEVRLASRAADDRPWRERARQTAFRIESAGGELASAAVAVGARDRYWKVSAGPGLERAPTLRVGYRPDTLVALHRGEPPFLLAAGSARSVRPEHPIGALVDVLREELGPQWSPPQATLGPGQPLAGDGALQASLPWQRWLLWAVLLLGAALVVGMVLQLLRRHR